MKTKLFTLFLALIISVGTMLAWDYERVQIGDLYYNLDATNQTAEVTPSFDELSSLTEDNINWSKSSNIPASVEYNSNTYSVTSIGNYAFVGYINLSSVTIPNSVTSIGDSAFWHCYGLSSVTIPNSVTSIGSGAFYDIYTLRSVTLGSNVTSIGDYAFAECWYLTSISIPNSVTSIGDGAFYGCRSLTSVDVATENEYYSSIDGVLFDKNKAKLVTYPGGKQGAYTIPSSVTSIERGAFYKCAGLTAVIIPSSITSIGEFAFFQCYNLTSVSIPNSVTSIGEYAFDYVGNVIYEGTASGSPWGARCVNGYVEGWLVYQDATKTQLEACFAAAKGEVTIPRSVTSIGWCAFYECTGLTLLIIPNSVTSIGWNAFNGVRCVIYNGNTSGTSWGAKRLLRGDLVEGNWVYETYTKQKLIGYLGNDKILSIPSGVTTIADEIIIPESGQSENYSIESIEIPNGVKNIREYAFYHCANLSSITCYSKRVPTVTEHTFDGINKSTCILYVLADYLNNYVQDYYWGDFEDIRPIGAQSTTVTTTQAIPSTNSVDLSWVNVSGAATYDVILYDENHNIKCMFTFYADGHLKTFSMAPARHRDTSGQAVSASVQATGMSFTITSLNESTTYAYEIDAKNSNDVVIDTKTGTFTTLSPEGIEDILLKEKATKVLRDNQLFILRGDKTYTLQGQEVR